MNFLKNYSKAIGFSLLSILILTFIITLFNYIDLLSIKMVKIFTYIIPAISLLLGGIMIGKKSYKKGWLEGIKLGFIMNLILFIFNFIFFNQGYHYTNFILYGIIFIFSILGSMLGINLKRPN